MATETASTHGLNVHGSVPTVEVPAQKLLDNFQGANKLSIKLQGVAGIMTILTEQMAADTPENNALQAVASLIEDCCQMSDLLQWSYADEDRARRALGAT